MKKTWMIFIAGAFAFAGCKTSTITAVNLNSPDDHTEGIPYYLPKPYLVISKNVRYIPTPSVGLTQTVPIPGTFESSNPSSNPQGTTGGGKSGSTTPSPAGSTNPKPAGAVQTAAEVSQPGAPPSSPGAQPTAPDAGQSDGKSSQGSQGTAYGSQVSGPSSIAVVPAVSIPDGLVPQEFFTYQIIYLPDLTQKYGLKIKAGAGELRATLNLVNGWMHTGTGPLYLRNSYTAENVNAAGQAVTDLGQAVGNFAAAVTAVPVGGATKAATTGTKAVQTAAPLAQAAPPPAFQSQPNYAQIWLFELVVSHDGKSLEWKSIDHLPAMSRDWVGLDVASAKDAGGATPEPGTSTPGAGLTDFIVKDLKANWTIPSGNITVSLDQTTKTIKVQVSAKPAKAGATAKTLESDVRASVMKYVKQNKLTAFDASADIQVGGSLIK